MNSRLNTLYIVRPLYASDEEQFNMDGNIFNHISLAGLRYKKRMDTQRNRPRTTQLKTLLVV